MKVIRVKAKVKKTYTDEDLNQIYQRLANEYGKEIERLREENIELSHRNEMLSAGVAVWQKKTQEAKDDGMRAATDLAAKLVKVMDEAEVARAKTAELNIELAERGIRIEELERRIKWLEAHSNTDADFIS